MPNGHFTPDLFRFLRQLEKNNNKAWFEKNKDRYLELVRDPMLRFISDLGPRMRKVSRHIVVDPRPNGGSMFRIHRDTRFARDKSPYKTNAGAQFRHEAGKDVHAPGYYVHLGIDGVFAGAGIYHPDGKALEKIRREMIGKPALWKKAKSPRKGKLKIGLGGESLKRVPRGFDPDHDLAGDLKRKDIYLWAGFTEKQACGPRFLEEFAGFCAAGAPLMKFITGALKLKF